MNRHALVFVMLAAIPYCFVDADDRPPNIIVFYTDDHGHADLSCQGVFDDVRTPNVDALARSGVLARHGYSTAPQCVPSRAGLLTGRFQSRFGVETNGDSLEGFNRELTIAERLHQAGYVTAQFGKWHLGPGPRITEHGFQHVFAQNAQRPFAANITLDGRDREMSNLAPEMYHIDACSQAAASLIQRYKDDPFFLYVAYRAPHVPLDAPQSYLDRFPGDMPERRRQALAMLSAVDDGVGLITRTLQECGLSERTLIFYIGDNGAPLKIHKLDSPGGGPGWDGSLNDPLNGEKGMLAEGGMHTPFVVSWPGTILADQHYPHPVTALDVAATATALAGIETEPEELDGVNLIPYLSGQNEAAPHEALYWRWGGQSAIRVGHWKLLRSGTREYLFDLDSDLEEQRNIATDRPEVADRLRQRLTAWSLELEPPGLSETESTAARRYYDFYLDGLPAPPLSTPGADSDDASEIRWVLRNGSLSRAEDGWQVDSSGTRRPFLARNGLRIQGPVTATMELQSTGSGPLVISWRTSDDRAFNSDNSVRVVSENIDSMTVVEATLPTDAEIVHVRVQLPSGVTTIGRLELRPANGATIRLRE